MTAFRTSKKFSYSNNNVQLVRGGKQYFSLITELIDGAREMVQLLTYIFQDDDTGTAVANALMRAAKRNVKVFVVVDGYASQRLAPSFTRGLEEAGVHFRFFDPLLKTKNFYFGRRLHSKVLVVDSHFSVVGGVNIADRYNDMPDQPAWLDFALFAEGPVSAEASSLCWRIWMKLQLHKTPDFSAASFGTSKRRPAYSANVRLRRNDWIRNELEISASYKEMFRTAKSNITILSSYALPGNVFRNNLVRAVNRGVKVRMIISGKSDVVFVKHAERYWYQWLLRHNIEIYEYMNNVLHGKLAICDGEWMTIGSYNINDLSAYASIETNFDVKGSAFAKHVESEVQAIIDNDCVLVSKESLARTSNIFSRFGDWLSYMIIKATFNLFTIYYRQEK